MAYVARAAGKSGRPSSSRYAPNGGRIYGGSPPSRKPLTFFPSEKLEAYRNASTPLEKVRALGHIVSGAFPPIPNLPPEYDE